MLLDDKELEQIADRLADKLEARRQSIVPRLMDLAEAARYLGRTLSGLQHMVKRGALPVTRIDGKVQIDRQELDRLIKDRTS
jgi:excisionase family DNA binding protein